MRNYYRKNRRLNEDVAFDSKDVLTVHDVKRIEDAFRYDDRLMPKIRVGMPVNDYRVRNPSPTFVKTLRKSDLGVFRMFINELTATYYISKIHHVDLDRTVLVVRIEFEWKFAGGGTNGYSMSIAWLNDGDVPKYSYI